MEWSPLTIDAGLDGADDATTEPRRDGRDRLNGKVDHGREHLSFFDEENYLSGARKGNSGLDVSI